MVIYIFARKSTTATIIRLCLMKTHLAAREVGWKLDVDGGEGGPPTRGEHLHAEVHVVGQRCNAKGKRKRLCERKTIDGRIYSLDVITMKQRQ